MKIFNAIFFSVFLMSGKTWANEITDVTGRKFVFEKPAQKIVTLAPSVAELTADLLGQNLDSIVGVTEYTDYPPALKSKTIVGTYVRFNVEKIFSLKPDLVLATKDGNPEDQISRLRDLGLKVIVIDTDRLDSIYESMHLLGVVLGKKNEAALLIAKLQKSIQEVKKKRQLQEKKTILIQVGADPIVVAGGKTFLNEVLDILGFKNVYSTLNARYPHLAIEDILSKNPDYILSLMLSSDPKMEKKLGVFWSQYHTLSAVKNGKVKIHYSDELLRPSMRLLYGILSLEKKLYE